MALFGAAPGRRVTKATPSEICLTYATIMKAGTVVPYLKKLQQKI